MTTATKKPDPKPAPAKPFVEIPEYVSKSRRATWSSTAEGNLQLVLEANRRFLIETNDDPRLAATMTLSWAMMWSYSE